MPEEKQRKRRIRVEKLDEWIEILKSTEKVNRDSEYFKQNAIRCIGLTRKLFMIFKTQENIITVLSEQIM